MERRLLRRFFPPPETMRELALPRSDRDQEHVFIQGGMLQPLGQKGGCSQILQSSNRSRPGAAPGSCHMCSCLCRSTCPAKSSAPSSWGCCHPCRGGQLLPNCKALLPRCSQEQT